VGKAAAKQAVEAEKITQAVVSELAAVFQPIQAPKAKQYFKPAQDFVQHENERMKTFDSYAAIRDYDYDILTPASLNACPFMLALNKAEQILLHPEFRRKYEWASCYVKEEHYICVNEKDIEFFRDISDDYNKTDYVMGWLVSRYNHYDQVFFPVTFLGDATVKSWYDKTANLCDKYTSSLACKMYCEFKKGGEASQFSIEDRDAYKLHTDRK
jgi:hypothetical protein